MDHFTLLLVFLKFFAFHKASFDNQYCHENVRCTRFLESYWYLASVAVRRNFQNKEINIAICIANWSCKEPVIYDIEILPRHFSGGSCFFPFTDDIFSWILFLLPIERNDAHVTLLAHPHFLHEYIINSWPLQNFRPRSSLRQHYANEDYNQSFSPKITSFFWTHVHMLR